MQKKHRLLAGIEPLLWGAVLLLLIAGLMLLRQQEAQVAYPDAVYVFRAEEAVS